VILEFPVAHEIGGGGERRAHLALSRNWTGRNQNDKQASRFDFHGLPRFAFDSEGHSSFSACYITLDKPDFPAIYFPRVGWIGQRPQR
jgi:hypothetical protein